MKEENQKSRKTTWKTKRKKWKRTVLKSLQAQIQAKSAMAKEIAVAKAHEILAEAKGDARLVKSKLLKRGSENAIEAMDNLFTIITRLTAQLAFAKGKLTAYEKVKGKTSRGKTGKYLCKYGAKDSRHQRYQEDEYRSKSAACSD